MTTELDQVIVMPAGVANEEAWVQHFSPGSSGGSMTTFDDEIARRIQDALDSGELRQAKGFGKPAVDDPGWDATPPGLRMPMKILKDAGAAPPEVALFHERARLRAMLAKAEDASERDTLKRQLSELEQKIAIRLEVLGIEPKP